MAYTCMHVCMYICMYQCMYVCTLTTSHAQTMPSLLHTTSARESGLQLTLDTDSCWCKSTCVVYMCMSIHIYVYI